MGATPPTHACAVRFMNFGAETKFEKGASDRNSPPGLLVSCPASARLPARNGLVNEVEFLGLITQNGE